MSTNHTQKPLKRKHCCDSESDEGSDKGSDEGDNDSVGSLEGFIVDTESDTESEREIADELALLKEEAENFMTGGTYSDRSKTATVKS